MLRSMILVLTLAVIAVPFSVSADEPAKDGETPVYELRIYTCNPGKLPDLHKRFRDHTMRLFEKHGIKNIAYWVPTETPDTLIYIVEHKSRAAAEKAWKEFRDDPEWQKAYKESHKNGVLVKKVDHHYMTPTEYSPMK
jgi:NIPSNAP